MYCNELILEVQRIRAKYKDIKLDSEYKDALFHAHLNSGLESLEKAANILGPCPCSEEDESDSWLFFVFLIMVLALGWAAILWGC